MQKSILFLAGALTGCVVDDTPVDEAEVSSPLYSTVGVERIIPLHYYVLDNVAATPCTTQSSDATIYEGVRIANRAWQSAGIQFYVSRIDRLNVPTLRDMDTLQRSFSSVLTDLQKLDPTLTSTSFSGTDTNEGWLRRVANRLDVREIPVVVPCSETPDVRNGHACFPDQRENHVLHLPPHALGTSTLSHELGHYMGLPHTFEVDKNDDTSYDLLYGVDGTNNTFFNTPADVAAFRASGKEIRLKDAWISTPGGATTCTYVDTTTCELQCVLNGRTFRTSTDPAVMRGLQGAMAGAPLGFE